MSVDDLGGIVRAMAWERAKGELRSMSASYIAAKKEFEAFEDALDKFIALVEENGLHE